MQNQELFNKNFKKVDYVAINLEDLVVLLKKHFNCEIKLGRKQIDDHIEDVLLTENGYIGINHKNQAIIMALEELFEITVHELSHVTGEANLVVVYIDEVRRESILDTGPVRKLK